MPYTYPFYVHLSFPIILYTETSSTRNKPLEVTYGNKNHKTFLVLKHLSFRYEFKIFTDVHPVVQGV